MLLSNLGLMATCLYSGRIASAIIDFINIFPFTDASCSISITPVIPAFNIFFLPAIIHAIMMVIKRDKDKKEADMRGRMALWQNHQELRRYSRLRT